MARTRSGRAKNTPAHRAWNGNTAFDLFDTGFGFAWFAGSAIMGLLYDRSLPALILFSAALQILALPALTLGQKEDVST